MSAADEIAALERNAALIKRVRLGALILVGIVVLLVAGYCAGTHHAATRETAGQLAQLKAEHRTLVDTIHQVERRIVVDTQRVRSTAAKSDTTRGRSDSTTAAVLAMAATAPSTSITAAVPAIHLCNDALAASDTEQIALRAELADMTEDRDAQTARADNDEEQMKKFKPPRFGFRSGVIVATTLTLAVTHPAQVVKVGRFLIGLVR